MVQKRLQNKIALVTGGSRGIGAAIAKRFAQEGCTVVISFTSARDKANAVVKDCEKEGVQAIALRADQADRAAIEAMVKQVEERFGRIDILVNNAGVFVGGTIDDPELDIEGLKNQWAVNVTGVFTTTRAVVPLMSSGGRVILVGSVNGERVPTPGAADYSTTKAALVGYTRGWARDLGSKNITVNLVQPGPIDTDMNPDNTEYAEIAKKSVPLGRYGRAEEVAALVAFVASDEAAYITGSTLTIDGGFLA